MVKIVTYMSMLVLTLAAHLLHAQTETDTLKLEVEKKKEQVASVATKSEKELQIEALKSEKAAIETTEKDKLKEAVVAINKKLEAGEITAEEANKQKQEAAKLAAQNIENKIAIVDNKIALAERGQLPFNPQKNDTIYSSTFNFGLGKVVIVGKDEHAEIIKNKKPIKEDKRTYGGVEIAFGFNNAIIESGGLDGSPYKIGASRFFEMGYMWNTRVFKNSNKLRFKYGLMLQYNGLKADDNKYFVKDGDVTYLEEHPGNVKKAKLRMDNLVVPLFLEFGPSKRVDHKDYFRYNTDHQFKFGIGVYGGVNYSTRQKLKYKMDGDRHKDKIKNNYNTNNVIYGIATYVGVGNIGLYAKYDLNPIFRNASVKQNNISLGIKIGLNN